MKIESMQVKIKDIFNGYIDNDDEGAFAYGKKLTIRPPYQREFVYNNEQEKAVIDTILKGFPLNIMYWVKTGKDTYEILDGQQRTLSAMHYLDHKYQVKYNNHECYIDTLTDDVYNKLLDYKFDIYVCEGTESEKLEWFRIVNIAGVELTAQELRNSVYTGTWLTDAKKYFSKNNCVAKQLSDKYIKSNDYRRQELLEKALKGICEKQKIKQVEEYMAKHKSDEDANELWKYFQKVIDWIEMIFPTYDKEMLGVDWCHLYNTYGKNDYNTKKIDIRVKELLNDDEVNNKKGIYEFALCEKDDPYAYNLLKLRIFDERDKKKKYREQNGICAKCKKHFEYEEMRGDHIKPWSKGGITEYSNLQMLCAKCNEKKSNMY